MRQQTRRISDRINGASGPQSNSRASDLGTGSDVINDPQPNPPGQNLNRSSQEPTTSTVESASQRNFGTTQTNAPRRRIQWTAEMNEFIVRTYYQVTHCESSRTGYRQALHNNFVRNYTHLSHINEQNIADRRAVIFKNNLVSEQRRNQIKFEIQAQEQPLDLNTPTIPTTDDISISITPTLMNEEPVETQMDTATEELELQLLEEFNKAKIEYEGIEPQHRPSLPKQRDSKRLSILINTANQHLLIHMLNDINNYIELDIVIYSMAIAVLTLNGAKIYSRHNIINHQTKNDRLPAWHYRLEKKISQLRNNIGILTSFKGGSKGKRTKNKVKKLMSIHSTHTNFDPVNITIDEVVDTLKQKLSVYAQRLRRYKKSNKRKEDNSLFNRNQKFFYRSLNNSETTSSSELPTPKQFQDFWSELWSRERNFNNDNSWLIKAEQEAESIVNMPTNIINSDVFDAAIKKLHNWKATGIDKIQNYWYKKLTSLHGKMLECINNFIIRPEDIPTYLCEGITFMKQKDDDTTNPAKYRPITCLNSFYKIITSCIAITISDHCENNNIISEEQKGCRKGSLGCKEQLIIDNIIMNQASNKQRNIHTVFVDYKKAYDSVPHDWLIKVLRLYKINDIIISFLETVMKSWCTKIYATSTTSKITTDRIPIKRGIFQGDTLSPIWFCLSVNPLSTLLNDMKMGFEIKTSNQEGFRISHLLYMDDLKIYSGTKKGLHEQIQITEKFSNDICMEFGVDKCKIQSMTRGKLISDTTYTTTTSERITAMEYNEYYKYLGMQQHKMIDHTHIKEYLTNEFVKRLKSVLKSALNSRNITMAINTYVIPTITYSLGTIKWSNTDLEDLERKIRVQMTRFKYHHPKSAIERISLPRNAGGRGIISLINMQSRQIDSMRQYFEEKSRTSQMHKIVSKSDYYTPLCLKDPSRQETTCTNADKVERWKQKALHGKHPAVLDAQHIDKKWSNFYLKSGQLYPETEGFIIAIQDQVICTKNYRKYIIKDPYVTDDKCRACGIDKETIKHILAGCTVLAHKEYKKRHDLMGAIIHRTTAIKLKLVPENTDPYYKYKPSSILENSHYKLYWDRTILTDRTVQHNRPDLLLWNKREKKVTLVDFAVVNDENLTATENTKRQKYRELAQHIKEQWNLIETQIVPVIISTTGNIPLGLKESIKKLQLQESTIGELQKSTILSSTTIVRQFMGENFMNSNG